jgi:hypothetical protein
MVSFKPQWLYYCENSPLDTKLHGPRAGLHGVDGIQISDFAGIELRFPGRSVLKTFFITSYASVSFTWTARAYIWLEVTLDCY